MQHLDDAVVEHGHLVLVPDHALVLFRLLLDGSLELLNQLASLTLASSSGLRIQPGVPERRRLLGERLLEFDDLVLKAMGSGQLPILVLEDCLEVFHSGLELYFGLVGRRLLAQLLPGRQLAFRRPDDFPQVRIVVAQLLRAGVHLGLVGDDLCVGRRRRVALVQEPGLPLGAGLLELLKLQRGSAAEAPGQLHGVGDDVLELVEQVASESPGEGRDEEHEVADNGQQAER